MFPTGDNVWRQRIKVNPNGGRIRRPIDLRPFVQFRRLKIGRATAIKFEMRVARGGTVGYHRHWLTRRVARRIHDLYIQDGRKPAKSLRANAKRVDLVKNLNAHGLNVIFRPARLQWSHIDGLHQRLFGQQHAMFGCAANAYTQHAGRTPTSAHLRQHLDHPIDDIVRRVHHLELRLILAAAAFGRHIDRHLGSGHQIHMQNARRVVFGIAARERRVSKHRSAQFVFRMQIGAADARIDHVL